MGRDRPRPPRGVRGDGADGQLRQRTTDGRIAFGGLGAPYAGVGRAGLADERRQQTADRLRALLVGPFPVLDGIAGSRITGEGSSACPATIAPASGSTGRPAGLGRWVRRLGRRRLERRRTHDRRPDHRAGLGPHPAAVGGPPLPHVGARTAALGRRQLAQGDDQGPRSCRGLAFAGLVDAMEPARRWLSTTRIRVLWPDHLGLARGKYLPAALAAHGTSHCIGVFGQGFDRGITRAPSAGFETGFPDIEATFDPADGPGGLGGEHRGRDRRSRRCRRARRRLASSRPAAGDRRPRRARLSRQGRHRAGGLRARTRPGRRLAALVDTRRLRVRDRDRHRSGRRLRRDHATGRAQRLRLESFNSESDIAQFEFTLTYGDALDAVDRAFLFRLMAREVAQRHGLLLTFMGRPFGDRAGSGMHLNLSLSDDDGQQRVRRRSRRTTACPTSRANASPGCVEHHAGMTALCAPTVNAYKRLRPWPALRLLGQLGLRPPRHGQPHAVRTAASGPGSRTGSRTAPPTRTSPSQRSCTRRASGSSTGSSRPRRKHPTGSTRRRRTSTRRSTWPRPSMRSRPTSASSTPSAPRSSATSSGSSGPSGTRFTGAVTDWELREYLPFS